MKVSSRLLAVVVVVVLSVAGPAALAAPRDRDGIDFPSKIIRLIERLQHFFGITPQEDTPTPPKP